MNEKPVQPLTRIARVLVLIGASALWAGLESQAIPLNLPQSATAPDLMGSFQQVSYTTGSGLFQAIGSTTDYENGSVVLVDSGAYTLTATITGAGVLTSGSLDIEGDIGSGPKTLLAATLTALGYDNSGGNLFQFKFNVTGGDATIVSDFGGLGAAGGVIVDAWFENGGIPFSGSWTSDFTNDGVSGVSDAFAVPEPSSILVTVLAGVLWAGLITVGKMRNALVAASLRSV